VTAVVSALERAALLRFLAGLVRPPSDEQAAELREAVPALPAWLRDEAGHLAREAGRHLTTEYHRLLGPSGACRDCESDFVGDPIGGKGPLLADVAGFYRAFAFAPAEPSWASPDHLATELELLAYLAFKTAYAHHRSEAAQAEVCEAAAATFARDHLAPWVGGFCDDLEARARGGFYAGAARCLRGCAPSLGLVTPAPPDPDRRA
jgi:TorA maturation chaperone TorD